MKNKILIAVLVIIFIGVIVLGYSVWRNRYGTGDSSQNALIEEINVQKLVNGFDNNLAKNSNVAYDPKSDRLYVSGGLSSRYLAVINPDTDSVEKIIDTGVAAGGIMAYGDSGMIYSLNNNRQCFEFNPDTQKTQEIQDINVCQTAMDNSQYGVAHKRVWNGCELVANTPFSGPKYGGFPPSATQELNGAYNKIELMCNGVKKGEIVHGPDALQYDLDTKNGKIYASNTGSSSVSVFDLNKLNGNSTNFCANDSCWKKDISLGVAIDEILPDPSGNIYVRNRLGGSVIYKYDEAAKAISVFADNENNLSKKTAIWNANNWSGGGISMWPSGFAISKDNKEMYVLSHYNASVDVIDINTKALLSKISFSVSPKPRGDSLSSMIMDFDNNRLFAVWPEIGKIGVADMNKRQVISVIDLSQFGFDVSKAANRGYMYVKLGFDSKYNKLFVYLTDVQKLIKINGDNFSKEAELSVPNPNGSVLLMNNDKNEIYIGNQIIDSQNLSLKTPLPESLIPKPKDGPQAGNSLEIVGFDNSDNSLYANQTQHSETNGQYSQNTLYKFVNSQPVKQLQIGPEAIIPAKYYFDTQNQITYAYFMMEGVIMKYDLGKMSAYTAHNPSMAPKDNTNFPSPPGGANSRPSLTPNSSGQLPPPPNSPQR